MAAPRISGRFGLVVAALVLPLSLAVAPGPADAEKVGVAAAVNPDAFSSLGGERKLLRIGKSIFYNERISTDANGVVQVLLVDGSTFTVGKNSNVVIDRFVYDPRKKTGEIVATFSKGSMRFIGGKISKNPDGVKIGTPNGSLAIRGGMFQGNLGRGGSIFSFLYGKELIYTGSNGKRYTVYQPGYTLDLSSGVPTVRPTTPEDIALMMASLSNGNTNTQGAIGELGPRPDPELLAETLSLQQLIVDATSTRIDGEILKQLADLKDIQEQASGGAEDTAIRSSIGGFGTGLISDAYGYDFGITSSTSPNDYTFDGSNVTITLRGVEEGGSIDRGVFTFNPNGNPESNLLSAQLFNQNGNPIEVENASGFIVAEPGNLCNACDFIKWGEFGAEYTYTEGGSAPYPVTERIGLGWWVSGNVTAFQDLPTTGTASFKGTAVGSIALPQSQSSVVGRGDLGMSWNFASRKGSLSISNFDTAGGNTPLNVSGTMRMPGKVNRFQGALNGKVGQSPVSGGANGAFVTDGKRPAAGAIGNWGASSANGYRASGVFGAKRR